MGGINELFQKKGETLDENAVRANGSEKAKKGKLLLIGGYA